MPKEVKHTAELKKQRLKCKDKSAKYTPGMVYLQVLGSGAPGASRCLYMFSDQAKYLFNCGEGSQRLAHEHRMRLARLEHVFVTYPSWENIGGLPGLALTIQDVGVPDINIHGSQVIEKMFQSTRKFVILRDMAINVVDAELNGVFEDNTMHVTCVPLCLPSNKARHRSPIMQQQQGEDSSTEDEIEDYYAYEKNLAPFSPSGSKKGKNKKNKSALEQDTKRQCVEHAGSVSVAFICQLKAKAGALSLEACVERGVPPGPLLGRLKGGEDIILNNGTVVYSKDVTLPDDPGAIVIVVECPTEEFLDVLVKEETFHKYQGDGTPEDKPFLIAHFTPQRIMQNIRYKEWMAKFSNNTYHLIINDSNKCMGSTAVHRIQHKLNLLDKNIFRLLGDTGIPIDSMNTVGSSQMDKLNMQISENASPVHVDGIPGKVVEGKTLCTIYLRPNKSVDMSHKLVLHPKEYTNETLRVDGFNNATFEMESKLSKLPTEEHKEYPKVLFLGTGSCIPNKTRNTSGILLQISESECMLMDCGEGTFGQLVRYFGPTKWMSVIEQLKAVFISHLHADHHIGLIGVFNARVRLNIKSPLYLIAPKQIMHWLKVYDQHFEPVLESIQLVDNNSLVFNRKTADEQDEAMLKTALSMSSILTAPVKHCPNAYGISVIHDNGWKITYSGDTMPCSALVELGMYSDMLIHEATMEDDLENESKLKMHSTTSQAILVGNEMKAKFILLTHFSQRYAKVPRFNDKFSSNVGIAFDNMQVRLTDLRKLPLMQEPLKLMFGEHIEELEQKAVKRQLKLERQQEAVKGAT